VIAQDRSTESVRARQFNWRVDRDAVLSFQHEIYETNFEGCSVDDSFLYDYSLALREATRNPSENLLVLERGGEVVGFLWLSLMSTLVDDCVGYIKNIYVAPELRGTGCGRYLLQLADEWFQSNGATKATLDATACNERAVGLYRDSGYDVVRYRMEKHY
jgi:ribosomal protein S18 acetylase RimI-like enzyme